MILWSVEVDILDSNRYDAQLANFLPEYLEQRNRSYEVFSELYCCGYIFCSTLCEWIILGEPLVLHRYKTYLRVGHQKLNSLVAVHITLNILYGTNLRTRTWLVNFLTTIFGFYAKFYTMSKKKV